MAAQLPYVLLVPRFPQKIPGVVCYRTDYFPSHRRETHKFPFLKQRSENRGQHKPHTITAIYNSTEISDTPLNRAEGNKEENYLHYAVLTVSQRQADFLNGMLKTEFSSLQNFYFIASILITSSS